MRGTGTSWEISHPNVSTFVEIVIAEIGFSAHIDGATSIPRCIFNVQVVVAIVAKIELSNSAAGNCYEREHTWRRCALTPSDLLPLVDLIDAGVQTANTELSQFSLSDYISCLITLELVLVTWKVQ